MLSCEKVFYSFYHDDQEIPILKDLTFEFNKGETYSITGASGSGKSTLLNILSGLLAPASGVVQYEANSLYGMTDKDLSNWRLHQTGYIYQDFRLLPKLTALENVAFPLQLQGLKKAEAYEKSKNILAELGLSNREKHFPFKLSGGEQQRVALARAFVGQKQIIFADEPTGNLDAISAQKVMNSLISLNADNQTTLILVTHDELVASLMQRPLRMAEGILHCK